MQIIEPEFLLTLVSILLVVFYRKMKKMYLSSLLGAEFSLKLVKEFKKMISSCVKVKPELISKFKNKNLTSLHYQPRLGTKFNKKFNDT